MNYGKENIGANIKRYRLKKGMTQEQLAKELDVNRQTVGRWENGSLEPRTKKLTEIIDALGISEFDLYADEELTKETRVFVDVMAIDYVERCKTALQKLNYKGINKVTEYAELLANDKQYANSDNGSDNGK